jgi:AcrR family transcriptional regulator
VDIGHFPSTTVTGSGLPDFCGHCNFTVRAICKDGTVAAQGRRERKKLDTRRRIESMSLEMFERDGFDATTIDDIALAVDIAPRTFFHYFPTKEDVVLADYTDRLERIIDALGDRPPEEAPWTALERAFLAVAGDYEAERTELGRRFRIMMATPSVYARSLQLQAGWEDAVAEAIAERTDIGSDDDLAPRLLAAAALAAMRASLRHWLAHGGAVPLPGHVRDCFALLATGLGSVRA